MSRCSHIKNEKILNRLEVNNESELSTAIVENFKENKDKNYEIGKKIEDYGLNILNNVSKEIKKYINT